MVPGVKLDPILVVTIPPIPKEGSKFPGCEKSSLESKRKIEAAKSINLFIITP